MFSKKYYRDIKTICFDGAMMDKLTYAALKGIEANLSNVTLSRRGIGSNEKSYSWIFY